jgi:hypothetical protein
MGQQLDLVAQAIVADRFAGRDDPRVKLAAAFLQHAAVGYILRQRVLEAVLQVGKESSLVDELRRLQAGQSCGQHLVRQIRDHPEQGERHLPADHRCYLQQALVLDGKAIHACGQHDLHRRRDVDGFDRPRQTIVPGHSLQGLGFDQGPDCLLEEERVSALDQTFLQRLQARIVNRLHHQLENGVQEHARLLGIQVGNEFRRLLEIGEQDRHLFSFALEGAAGAQDLLRQVPWCISLRWSKEGSLISCDASRVRALRAKFCSR